MAGFAQAGGVGLALSQWMTQGEPDSDIYAMDVARFGSYASRNYTVAKGANSTHGDFRLLIRMNFGRPGAPRKPPPLTRRSRRPTASSV